MYLVAIIPPEQPGQSDVCRSKRPQGGANAAPHSWGYLSVALTSTNPQMILPRYPRITASKLSHRCAELPRTEKCSSTGLRLRSPYAHFVRTALMANKFLIMSSSDIGQVQP